MRAGQAIDDLVDGSVAAGGHNRIVTLRDGAHGQGRRVSGRTGAPHGRMVRKRCDLLPQPLGPLTTGGWVQDDENLLLFTLHIPGKFRSFPACPFLPRDFFFVRLACSR